MSPLNRPASARLDAGAVLFALAWPSLLTWAYFVLFARGDAWVQQIVYGAGKTIQFAFPLLWVLLVRRGRPAFGRPGARGVVEGLLFGGAVFGGMLLLYHGWLAPSGLFPEAGQVVAGKVGRFGVSGLAGFVALGAFYSIVHSFLEEYYWRWFVFGQLRRQMAWQAAMVVSSLGFMAHHVILLGVIFHWSVAPTVLFSLAVAIGGAVWAWIYHRSGSLVGPWLSHLLIDAGIFTLGYELARPFLPS